MSTILARHSRSSNSFLYIAGIEEKYGAPVMVDFSIGNVCVLTHYDEYKVFNVGVEEGRHS